MQVPNRVSTSLRFTHAIIAHYRQVFLTSDARAESPWECGRWSQGCEPDFVRMRAVAA